MRCESKTHITSVVVGVVLRSLARGGCLAGPPAVAHRRSGARLPRTLRQPHRPATGAHIGPSAVAGKGG